MIRRCLRFSQSVCLLEGLSWGRGQNITAKSRALGSFSSALNVAIRRDNQGNFDLIFIRVHDSRLDYFL